KEVSVADRVNFKFGAQDGICLFTRKPAPHASGPSFLKFQILDNRIKDAGALDNLVDGWSQGGVVHWLGRRVQLLSKNVRILRRGTDLDESGGLIFARLKISHD